MSQAAKDEGNRGHTLYQVSQYRCKIDENTQVTSKDTGWTEKKRNKWGDTAAMAWIWSRHGMS